MGATPFELHADRLREPFADPPSPFFDGRQDVVGGRVEAPDAAFESREQGETAPVDVEARAGEALDEKGRGRQSGQCVNALGAGREGVRETVGIEGVEGGRQGPDGLLERSYRIAIAADGLVGGRDLGQAIGQGEQGVGHGTIDGQAILQPVPVAYGLMTLIPLPFGQAEEIEGLVGLGAIARDALEPAYGAGRIRLVQIQAREFDAGPVVCRFAGTAAIEGRLEEGSGPVGAFRGPEMGQAVVVDGPAGPQRHEPVTGLARGIERDRDQRPEPAERILVLAREQTVDDREGGAWPAPVEPQAGLSESCRAVAVFRCAQQRVGPFEQPLVLQGGDEPGLVLDGKVPLCLTGHEREQGAMGGR